MGKLARHWTDESVDDFLHRIASDFIGQIEQVMGEDISQAKLASLLGVSEGRVSQVLNNPGNLTLRKVIEYARALQMKVAIVAYNDDDPLNENGPINSGVFAACWEQAGKPTDFFAVAEPHCAAVTCVIQPEPRPVTITEGNIGFKQHPVGTLDETSSTSEVQLKEIQLYGRDEATRV